MKDSVELIKGQSLCIKPKHKSKINKFTFLIIPVRYNNDYWMYNIHMYWFQSKLLQDTPTNAALYEQGKLFIGQAKLSMHTGPEVVNN